MSLQKALAALGANLTVDYTAYEPPPPACEICNDRGWIVPERHYTDPEFSRPQYCPNPECRAGNALRMANYESRYSAARFPDEYKSFTFDSWIQGLPESAKKQKVLALAAANLWAIEPDHKVLKSAIYHLAGKTPPDGLIDRAKNSLVFYGGVGVGKTGLMIAACNRLLATGGSVLYVKVLDLIESVQSGYSKDSARTAPEIKADFKNAPVLFVDEFAVTQETPDRQEIIFDVINARYSNGLPTLITANMNPAAFAQAWGERTASRVKAMAHWVEVKGARLRPDDEPL